MGIEGGTVCDTGSSVRHHALELAKKITGSKVLTRSEVLHFIFIPFDQSTLYPLSDNQIKCLL